MSEVTLLTSHTGSVLIFLVQDGTSVAIQSTPEYTNQFFSPCENVHACQIVFKYL